jgi:hypothetical protein
MVIDKKPPFTILPGAKQYCPASFGRNFKSMLFVTFSIPNGWGIDMITTGWSVVDIIPFDDNGYKITSMIMKVRTDVGTNPMVNSD